MNSILQGKRSLRAIGLWTFIIPLCEKLYLKNFSLLVLNFVFECEWKKFVIQTTSGRSLFPVKNLCKLFVKMQPTNYINQECRKVNTVQWRSQDLHGWASRRVAHPEGQNEEENEQSFRINKKNWLRFEEKWRKWNSCPSGTVKLATALIQCKCFLQNGTFKFKNYITIYTKYWYNRQISLKHLQFFM